MAVKVDIENIDDLNARRKLFNSLDLRDCEFYEKGVKVEIPPEIIEKWRFMGLSNTDFIEFRYWLQQKNGSE